MGFFKNMIKAREEWLSKPYFRNQPQNLDLDTNTNTNVKTKTNENAKTDENANAK